MSDKPEDVRGDIDPTASPIDQFAAAQHSRRNIMKWGSLLSAMSMTGVLAACGNDDDPLPTPTPSPTPTPTPAASVQVSSFGLAVLPDTQFYSRYATEGTGNQFKRLYGSEPYLAQTQWLAKNAAALKIPFVIHVGDVVDQVGVEEQWKVADTAMKVLEDAKLPYSVVAGNHDVRSDAGYDSARPDVGTDADRNLADEPYLKWFPTERAARQKTFGGRHRSGFHEYHTFEAEGQKFLVLAMSWRTSKAGIIWAQNVLNANPTLPCILVNHELLGIANDAVSPLEGDYGKMLWENLIRTNDQIFMTLNGHIHGSSRLTKKNDFGNDVLEMVVDYQMAYQGGNGLMRFYEFDLTNNKIHALSFSPWVPQKPKDTLNAFDQAMLTEDNHQFTVSMNFAERFKRFAPTFKAAAASNLSLTAATTKMIMDGFTAVPVPPAAPAASAEDYVKIAGTTAHWRFYGGTNGAAVPVGQVIADASGGNNPLKRAALNVPATNTAQASDLTWSDDHHYLSAAPGSVVFSNTSNAPRLSYFLTDVAAQMNDDAFEQGYTIEAFVKIAKDWTATNNAWMNVMTRGGRRDAIPGWSGSYGDSPPIQFAVSNLREIQWEVPSFTAAGPVRSRTAWSGEIIVDRWMHLAFVNDPVAKTITMYIEGAPVLRNAVDAVGLPNNGLPWVVGAGASNLASPGGGFLGAIGEIRIVPKPLLPAQWLTARAPK
ncbi:LamG-like jellyroll fold domain-containing protein [Sphingomonas endolithica]|uniref:LamG-like jellyroll fold domain-containing protein n=1 Tax=Sphingomonas endolithica TaxID=2972485 RepID=UPI0021AE46BF|nr:LamG-like jellyroll fold domain-containing protein [Sphingomonas sp. ZFBP2030]